MNKDLAQFSTSFSTMQKNQESNKPKSYKDFLSLLLHEYNAFSYEVDSTNPLYSLSKCQNWAVRQSRRFYHILKTCDEFLGNSFTVLDIGAFPGSYLKILQLIYGTDRIRLIASGMPNNTSFVDDMLQLGIEFISCDLDDSVKTKYPKCIELGDNSVDLIICTEMVEHMYTLEVLYPEILRVLKPGGSAYISTNNISYLPGIVSLLKGGTNLDKDLRLTSVLSNDEWRGHVRFFSLDQLIYLANHFNFSVSKSGYFQMRVPKMIVKDTQKLRWYLSRILDFFVYFFSRYRSHIYIVMNKP